MDAAMLKKDEMEVITLPQDGEAIVVERLRVLLGLAISVGRREGLLNNTIRDTDNEKGGSHGDKRCIRDSETSQVG
jgi:hypothetical protein